MANHRKYYSYRGRRSRTKTALAVVLVLVILAAIVVILLQRNLVYDETGTPYLELPWQEEKAGKRDDPLGEVELTIESQTTALPQLNAFLLPEGQLTHKRWEEAAQEAPCGTAVLTLKGKRVWFDADAAVPGAVSATEDTAALLETVAGGSQHSIARISCFHDAYAANSDAEGMALQNTGGYIFYDGDNSQWLDPAKPAARKYLCNLACEIAALGFDELLLTDVSYPTEGKLDKIAVGEAPKEENLLQFLRELRAALDPYAVVLSVEVSTDVLSEGRDAAAGLTLAGIAGVVDRICAPASPEQAETFSAAVAAAGGAAEFVPILTAEDPLPDGESWLIGE